MRLRMPETIETERLTLRQFRDSDCEDLKAYYTDPECMRFTTGRALEDWECWRTMATMVGHWSLRGYGPYAVEIKESGIVAGPVGLWFPDDWPEPEIKWGIRRSCWRQGIAREAASAVHSTAAKNMPELHLISLIVSGNAASVALARSMGATLEGEMPFRGKYAEIYRHIAP